MEENTFTDNHSGNNPETKLNDVIKDSTINENNLLFKIWVSPKETLAYILKYCPEKYVIPLLVLGGIVRALDRASTKNMGDHQSTFAILLFAIIGGGLFGWITYYFYAWLVEVSGKWLKGNATFSQIKTVLVWASVPSISGLILLVPQLVILGDDLFKSVYYYNNEFEQLAMVTMGLLEIVLGIWTLVIFVKGIMLVQNFGAGKAFLNAIIPVFMILIPIFALVFLFKIFI